MLKTSSSMKGDFDDEDNQVCCNIMLMLGLAGFFLNLAISSLHLALHFMMKGTDIGEGMVMCGAIYFAMLMIAGVLQWFIQSIIIFKAMPESYDNVSYSFTKYAQDGGTTDEYDKSVYKMYLLLNLVAVSIVCCFTCCFCCMGTMAAMGAAAN